MCPSHVVVVHILIPRAQNAKAKALPRIRGSLSYIMSSRVQSETRNAPEWSCASIFLGHSILKTRKFSHYLCFDIRLWQYFDLAIWTRDLDH